MGYTATPGKGESDSASRSRDSSSRQRVPGGSDRQEREAAARERTSKSRSRPGQPDRPGEAEAKLRAAGVSERDIKAGGSESWRPGSDAYRAKVAKEIAIRKPGQPDLPGEARMKMIAAGVLTPEGQRKEITGHYRDPITGTYKFAAAGEPLPTYREREMFGPFQDSGRDMGDTPSLDIWGIPQMKPAYVPPYSDIYSSGTLSRPSGFVTPTVKPESFLTKWYETQKTKLGVGGAREAESYQAAVKEYEMSKFTGDKARIKAQETLLQSKYAEYEQAKGISPLIGKGIDPKSTFGAIAHRAAEDIRADKPTYGGWQGELSRTINEAIAANVEFLGTAPSLVRHGVPAIAKQPVLLPTLAVVAGGGIIESFRKDPIQTTATMALTGAVVKGGIKTGRTIQTYQPRIVTKHGVVGIISPKHQYHAYFEPKTLQYMIETPKTMKGGALKYPKSKGMSPEGIKIESLMPDIMSRQLTIKAKPTIIDVAKAQTHKDPHIRSAAKQILEQKAQKTKLDRPSKILVSDIKYRQARKGMIEDVISEAKKSMREKKTKFEQPQSIISEIRYRQARRGITEETITKAKREMMEKEVMQIMSRRDRYQSGVTFAEPKIGKMGTRYRIDLSVKKPSKQKVPREKVSEWSERSKTLVQERIRPRKEYFTAPKVAEIDVIDIKPFVSIEEDYISKAAIDKKKKKSKKRSIISKPMVISQMLPDTFTETQPLPQIKTITKTKTISPPDIPVTPVTETKIKDIPKEIVPRIPLPKAYPKKKRPAKKKLKKAAAYQVINPIADVEAVMKRVSGM